MVGTLILDIYSHAWEFLEQDLKNNPFQIVLAESIPAFSLFLIFFLLFPPSITLPLFFVYAENTGTLSANII